MNPFDTLEEESETVKIQLISTWTTPFLVTIIITVFTLMLLPQLENMTEELPLISCAAPILALMSIMLLDFLPKSNKTIHSISKHTGLVFVFFCLYIHLWDKTSWSHFNSGFFILCQSVGVITASGFIDKLFKRNRHNNKKMIKCGQIILTSIFLILPNSFNTNLEKSPLETILRIVLFTITAWIQLFAAVVFEDEVDEFEFFNGFWWILIVQRFMIPLIGFVWMNLLLKVSKYFSNQKTISPKRVHTPESTPLLEEVIQEIPQDKKSPIPQKKPTTMFKSPLQEGEPRQRMLRRSWKTRGSLQPKMSQKDQIAKLQELSSGVDVVSDVV